MQCGDLKSNVILTSLIACATPLNYAINSENARELDLIIVNNKKILRPLHKSLRN